MGCVCVEPMCVFWVCMLCVRVVGVWGVVCVVCVYVSDVWCCVCGFEVCVCGVFVECLVLCV